MAERSTLRMFSFNHENTPLDQRDELAFPEDQIREFLPLAHDEFGGEFAILSTCNRTEFYLWGDPGQPRWQKFWAFIADYKDLKQDAFTAPKRARNCGAARHLCRVAASLESLALGENEILGQVKDAHDLVLEADFDSPGLDELFQIAIRAGKEVRTETSLCSGAVSVSSVAVDLATKIFGNFDGRNVVLVGAGDTAESAAEHFRESGASQFIVVNRSAETGRALADRFDGEFVALENIQSAFDRADVAVVATGAPDPVVSESMVRRAMRERRGDPVFLIDISNPRNVEPSCGDLPEVYLYNMDDLQQVVAENLEERRDEIPEAEAVVDHYVEQWDRWHQQQIVAPTISTLARYFEEIRKQELSRHDGELSDAERDRLENFSKGLVKKLLHNPITNLRSAVENDSLSSEQIDLVWHLYNLREFEEQSDEN